MGRNTKVVAVDFDGTLFNEGRDGGFECISNGREALVRLKSMGCRIVIYTCRTAIADARGDLEQEVMLIESLLKDHGIPFDEIYMGHKLVADIYIDDRAVDVSAGWDSALSQLVSRLRD